MDITIPINNKIIIISSTIAYITLHFIYTIITQLKIRNKLKDYNKECDNQRDYTKKLANYHNTGYNNISYDNQNCRDYTNKLLYKRFILSLFVGMETKILAILLNPPIQIFKKINQLSKYLAYGKKNVKEQENIYTKLENEITYQKITIIIIFITLLILIHPIITQFILSYKGSNK